MRQRKPANILFGILTLVMFASPAWAQVSDVVHTSVFSFINHNFGLVNVWIAIFPFRYEAFGGKEIN